MMLTTASLIGKFQLLATNSSTDHRI